MRFVEAGIHTTDGFLLEQNPQEMLMKQTFSSAVKIKQFQLCELTGFILVGAPFSLFVLVKRVRY